MKDLNDIHHRAGVVRDLAEILGEHLTETSLVDAAERLGAAITLVTIVADEAKKLDEEIQGLFENKETA